MRSKTMENQVLADRVRAQLKLVTDGWALPLIHATVASHLATLHGEIAKASDATLVETAVAAVPGIEGVVSHLHETPPAPGAEETQESADLRRLLEAARDSGCTPPADIAAVRTVLAIFFEHLPAGVRLTLLTHLAPDVKRLAISPRRSGIAISLLANNLSTLVEAVAIIVAIPRDAAHEVVVTVLQTLHEVLPADVRDIQAYLPLDLADVWTVSTVPRTPAPIGD